MGRCRRRCAIDARAERAVAVPAGRGEGEQRRVELDLPGSEQAGDVRQEHRHEVGPASGHGFPERPAGKQRYGSEAALHAGRDVRGRAVGVHVVEGDVLEVRAGDDRFEKRRRSGGRPVDEHVHPATDQKDCLGRRCPLDLSHVTHPINQSETRDGFGKSTDPYRAANRRV